jgi:hypothetical protein
MEEELIMFVTEKKWGPDDSYLGLDIGTLQVRERDGFKPGQKVKVTVKVEAL